MRQSHTSSKATLFAAVGILSAAAISLGVVLTGPAERNPLPSIALHMNKKPLTKAELVHNGAVIATAKLSDDRRTATLNQEVAMERGGWLAFRADGPGTIDTATASLNALTNPVYIEADGVVHRSAEEASAFLKWIDQFEIVLRGHNRFPTAKLRQQAQEQMESARGVYRKIVRSGR